VLEGCVYKQHTFTQIFSIFHSTCPEKKSYIVVRPNNCPNVESDELYSVCKKTHIHQFIRWLSPSGMLESLVLKACMFQLKLLPSTL